MIGLVEKLHASRPGKRLKAGNDLRMKTLQLIEKHPRYGEGQTEFPSVPIDQTQKEVIGGKIALIDDFVQNLPVAGLIFVIPLPPDREHRVAPQAAGLVDLKAKANGGHALIPASGAPCIGPPRRPGVNRHPLPAG